MEGVKPYNITVFTASATNGGNPTTIFLGADSLTAPQMQSLAQKAGHECGFVLEGSSALHPDCQYQIRYWVPGHEMEMCGHATVGAVWILHQIKSLPTAAMDGTPIRISTLSGIVEARVQSDDLDREASTVFITQPFGSTTDLEDDHVLAVCSCLGISQKDLMPGFKVQNGCTSRVKTLVPLKNRAVIDRLSPDSDSVEKVCELIGSTGLYPYVVLDSERQLVEARQFPKSSGYVEDPATGIAASALSFGLLDNGLVSSGKEIPVIVRQGWSMGRPSEIRVSFRSEDNKVVGCWVSGKVMWADSSS